MQKKIIALAVAAVASGAAFAQSNVTISGNMQYQAENVQGSNPTMNTTAGANMPLTTTQYREGRNRLNDNGAMLRFSVTEGLGNGLKALAQIETGLSPRNTGSGNGGGTIGGVLGSRNTYVGMSGAFGTVLLGRMDVHYNSHDKIDSFWIGSSLAQSNRALLNGIGGGDGGAGGYGAGIGGRLGNTMAYVTPNVSGFQATFGYSRPNVSGFLGAASQSVDGVMANGVSPLPTAANCNAALTGGASAANTVGLSTAGAQAIVGTASQCQAQGIAANTTAYASTVTRKESGWLVAANYDNGPVTAVMSYLAHNDIAGSAVYFMNDANALWNGRAITADTQFTQLANANQYAREVRSFRMGGAYTFPMGLKIGVIFDHSKTLWRDDSNDNSNANDDLNMKRTVWVFPVSYAFGPHTIGASYGRASNLTVGGTLTSSVNNTATNLTGLQTSNGSLIGTANTGARMWTVGYQYAFSKRTNMSVGFSRIDNDQRAIYDFAGNAALGIGTAAVNNSATNNLRGSDPTNVHLGLRHTF